MKAISRSKVALYIECPCCFYKSVKWNIQRPPGFPFTLNNAVDVLLKKEFDGYRAFQQVHPLLEEAGLDYIPAQLPELEEWRNARKGIRYKHPNLEMELYGAVDDIWVNGKGELMVVDYKATAKKDTVTELNAIHHIHYKRQMEFYQWLLHHNGYEVDPIGMFVYCTGKTGEDGFNSALLFDIRFIPHTGSWEWIEPLLYEMKECLQEDIAPEPRHDCTHCIYIKESLSAVQ